MKKVLFLIDALDQLPSNEDVSRFSWAPEGLGSTWICIASAQPDTRILREHADVQIGSLTKEEQVRIINGQFARYGKSLDGSVIQGIIGMPGSENPLYLRLVLARLLMIYRTDFEQINRDASRYGGAMESINHHLREIIASLPEKTQDLSAQILTHAVKLSSQVVKGDPETLLKSLDLIALSRYRIRLSDLEHAANLAGDSWNTLQFEWLRYFLDFCFTEQSDGRINFSHQSLRKGLLNSRNIDSPQNHELLMKTLSISQSEAAVGDSFYHMFCLGPKASSHLERMFFRIVDSMNNTLASGSVVLCERNVPPERGTLTLFDYEQALLIKRVIALGGDEVIVSEDGVIVNGAALAEDYAIPGGERLGDMEYPLTVPEGGMFVMGDYRAMSVDSRSSTFGVIDSRTSLGRPVFVLWPLFRLGALER